MAVDPVTPQEWQDAVDAARTAELIASAQRYGLLLSVRPVVATDRCEQILADGRERGFTPAADAAERFVAALRGAVEVVVLDGTQ